jgi:hypothetical protein
MRAMIGAGAALVCVAVAACTGRKDGPAAISRERFVQANVDLRSVPDTAARGDSLRAAALRRHRVSDADLRRFVNVHQRNLEYMAAVWREIADSVQKRYDRSFPLSHPTGEHPEVPPPAVPPTAAPRQPPSPGNQPPVARNRPPVAGNQPPVAAPPRGLTPQRPHPPKLPVNGPRMVPQVPPGSKPPSTPPVDTVPRH